MPNFPDDMDKMSDEELFKISIGQLPSGIFDSKDNISANATIIQAELILRKRQKKKENCMIYMTAIILILTILLVYSEFFHKTSPAPMPVSTDNMQSQQLNPTEKKETPKTKKDIPNVITHDSTSTKQK